MAAAPSQVRQNYHPDCEEAVNSQIQLQLYASYVYLSLAFYCDRDDVALERFAGFFLRQSHEWRMRSEKLLSMQNQRGGRMSFEEITKPPRSEWYGGLRAMGAAFRLEMTINQSLLDLHCLAKDKGDAHLCAFLQRHCLPQQVEVLKEIGGYLTNLSNMGAPADGLAEYLFDRLTLGNKGKN